jgi:DNA polymerase-3 subunit beta
MAEMPIERVASSDTGHDYLGDYNVLVKAKTWKAFKRSISAKGEPLEIRFHEVTETSNYRVSFHQGAVNVSTLTVDGDYPRIRSLFPEAAPIAFEMDADLLASLVAQVSVTAERNTPVRLTYNGIDSLRVDAGTGEDAQAQAFMPYSSPRGNRGFAVCFNPKYLGEALKDLKGQTVTIQHTTAPKPALLTGSETADVQHLIMPVRLPS